MPNVCPPSCRWNWTADWPGVCVVIKYAPQNHVESGVWLDCMTVPAVREMLPLSLQARQRSTPEDLVAKR